MLFSNHPLSSCSIIPNVNRIFSKHNSTKGEFDRSLVEELCTKRSQRLELFRKTGWIINPSLENRSHYGNSTPNQKPFKLSDYPSNNLPPIRQKRLVNNLLLSIEIIAIFGLLFIAYSGFIMLQELNREVAKAMVQPTTTTTETTTLTTTPSVSSVLLPSGHTPPNSPGGARPIEAEITEISIPSVQSLEYELVPTKVTELATRIVIPVIGVDASIVRGDGWEQLKKGVGHHIGSANPGEDSNMVLSAHNDIYGEIFRYLDRLTPGDQVVVYTHQRTYTYLVSETQIVNPDHTEVLKPTNHSIVTLISCYPYLINNKRIVVTALLASEDP
jgi:sortase A